jgi:hypothetical protein
MRNKKSFGGLLVGPILVLLLAGCSSPNTGEGGTGSSSGSQGEMSGGATAGAGGSGTGSAGQSGTASGGKSGSSSGSNASGGSGSSAGSSSGGGSGASGSSTSGAVAFVCPPVPGPGMAVPGTCLPPADLRCPYPKLSQTGCIDPSPFSNPKVPITMGSKVVPYEVNSPLWSDGAYKTRGMRLPDSGLKIHVKDCVTNPAECCVIDLNTGNCLPPADDGKWVFPVGTVMVKNFMFPDASRPSGYKLVETRLFVHLEQPQTFEGVQTEWIGYGYQWDDAQTDATIIGGLVDGSDTGISAMFSVVPTMGAATQSITWKYPSRNDCLTCHTAITPVSASGGYTLGPETIQMNRVATGDTMNQIDKFAALGMFETAPTKPYLTALVAPYPGQSGSPPATATLEQRARSYLHANCSFCHRPDGVWNGFDVRYDVPLQSTDICNAVPGSKDYQATPTEFLLAPGSSQNSVIWLRMDALPGAGRMPAIASFVIDTQGTGVVGQWIDSITTCPM